MLPKSIQTVFQFTLLILSGLMLMLSCYQLVTVNYPTYNFIAILVFNVPVLLAFILSATLIKENK